MNGVIYCRVSSKEQTRGTSLDSQELACRDYARAKGIKILKVFVERGESAKFADRAQLLELIDFVSKEKGQVQALVVWKVDRFARNVGDHFSIKAMLMKYGVRIVSVTEPIDANPEGKLMETILAGFAQFDNDIRAMRSVQGMRRKIQDGLFPWHPPLGYKSATRAREKKTVPDTPDRPLFDLLQKAWTEFATGAYTKAEIRRLMASWGIATRKGEPLSSQSIDHFFRNRYYAGKLLEPWSGEEFEGKHISMVTEGDFARVQQVIAKRNRSISHQKVHPEFPLRGLVRCATCGRYLTGSFSRGRSRRYAYYHCGNRKCPSRGRTYPVQPAHEEFEAFLQSVAAKPEVLEQIGSAVLRVAEGRRQLQKTRAARHATEIERLRREVGELIRMRAQGLISDDEFLGQKAALDRQRFAREATISDADADSGRLRRDLEEITSPLQNLRETWKALPAPVRRRFDHLLLPAGFVNGKVRTAELGLLFRAFQASTGADANGVAPVGKCWNRLVAEISAFARLLRSLRDPDEPSQEALPRNADDGTPWDTLEPEASKGVPVVTAPVGGPLLHGTPEGRVVGQAVQESEGT